MTKKEIKRSSHEGLQQQIVENIGKWKQIFLQLINNNFETKGILVSITVLLLIKLLLFFTQQLGVFGTFSSVDSLKYAIIVILAACFMQLLQIMNKIQTQNNKLKEIDNQFQKISKQ